MKGFIDKTKFPFVVALLLALIAMPACSELETPEAEEFYSKTKPPRVQEFRWSNGGTPKSFDPASVSAPPETDIVRAVYEGLTEADPKDLDANPAVAESWSSDPEAKVWTFKLRKDAKWSNGKRVTAHDFVASWKRVAAMGKESPNYQLLRNIVGFVEPIEESEDSEPKSAEKDAALGASKTNINPTKSEEEIANKETAPKKVVKAEANPTAKNSNKKVNKSNEKSLKSSPLVKKNAKEAKTGNLAATAETANKNGGNLATNLDTKDANDSKETEKKLNASSVADLEKFGVKANGDYELVVNLYHPDKEFPRLVANPVFLPLYEAGSEFAATEKPTNLVTNGAFKIKNHSEKDVTIEASNSYWDRKGVTLKQVKFVAISDPDSALKAYRNAEVDVVTNAAFAPLALKLLTPFSDFQRLPHGALNLYEFNLKDAPFNDRRVRQALAISIDRKKITRDEMEGSTTAADRYLPFENQEIRNTLAYNPEKARDLLKQAGYENGVGFPVVRLVINRNNIQEKIAKSVAEGWKQDLNIDTEIIIKEPDELKVAKEEGDFDVLRKNVVLPTTDEAANMLAIFNPSKPLADSGTADSMNGTSVGEPGAAEAGEGLIETLAKQNPGEEMFGVPLLIDVGDDFLILNEEDALEQVPGIPIYFPRSYSLVKPYVEGFEMNLIDAPSLKTVRINSNWVDPKEGE